MDHANTFRAKKQIELLLENIHDPKGDYGVEQIGALLGYLEIKKRSGGTSENESGFLTKVERIMTQWLTSNWKGFPTSKDEPADSAPQVLERVVEKFSEGGRGSMNCSTQETELIRGYVIGLRAYGDTEASTDQLEKFLSASNQRYDRSTGEKRRATRVAEAKRRSGFLNNLKRMFTVGLVKSWYLILIGIGLTVGGYMLGNSDEVVDAGRGMSLPVGTDAGNAHDARLVRSFRQTPRKSVQAQGAIDLYIKQNEATGAGEDEEKNLYRIGNLYYSRIFDYEKAALAYVELIAKYPNTDKLQMAYVALADCYHQLKDSEQEMETYAIIMQEFPEDSPAYQLAKEKVSGN